MGGHKEKEISNWDEVPSSNNMCMGVVRVWLGEGSSRNKTQTPSGRRNHLILFFKKTFVQLALLIWWLSRSVVGALAVECVCVWSNCFYVPGKEAPIAWPCKNTTKTAFDPKTGASSPSSHHFRCLGMVHQAVGTVLLSTKSSFKSRILQNLLPLHRKRRSPV